MQHSLKDDTGYIINVTGNFLRWIKERDSLYPKPSVWERIRHKPPSVYGSIEHTFYAFKINKPPLIPNMWNKDKPEIQISSPKDCTYFSLNTVVGVGAKGQNNIKIVHIRFVLMPMKLDSPEPEVVSIFPTNISRTVGEIKEMQKYENERSASGGVKASGGYGSRIARFGARFGAGFRKQSLSSKIKESTLPNELLIANASGTANRAIWEFYQGDGIEAIGQYNLQIIFRLRGQPHYKKECCYCVDWNVEVNRRKLWDHKAERENSKWNVKFNGRRLMYNESNDEQKRIILTMQNDRIEKEEKEERKVEKYRKKYIKEFREKEILAEKIEQKVKQEIEQKVKQEIGDRLVKLMLEDDPDMEKRLLRPLVLLPSSEPKGSYSVNQISLIQMMNPFSYGNLTPLGPWYY